MVSHEWQRRNGTQMEDVYEGEFRDGKIGMAKEHLRIQMDSVYEGKWEDGRHGKERKSEVPQMEMSTKESLQMVLYVSWPKENLNIQMGAFTKEWSRKNGIWMELRHGKGTVKDTKWKFLRRRVSKDNNKHGQGKIWYSDGSSYEGEFRRWKVEWPRKNNVQRWIAFAKESGKMVSHGMVKENV